MRNKEKTTGAEEGELVIKMLRLDSDEKVGGLKQYTVQALGEL